MQTTQSGIDISINISINDILSGACIRIGGFRLVINLGCYIAVSSDSAFESLQHTRMQASTQTAKCGLAPMSARVGEIKHPKDRPER